MDCPILCGGEGAPVRCPDRRCPLYEEGARTCQLLAAAREGKPFPELLQPATPGAAEESMKRTKAEDRDDLGARIDGIENRIANLAARLGEFSAATAEAQEQSGEALRRLVDRLGERFEGLEEQVGGLPERLTQLASKVASIGERLDGADGPDSMDGIVERLERALERMEVRIGERDGQLLRGTERNTEALEALRGRVGSLEESLAGSDPAGAAARMRDALADGIGGLGVDMERSARELEERFERLESSLREAVEGHLSQLRESLTADRPWEEVAAGQGQLASELQALRERQEGLESSLRDAVQGPLSALQDSVGGSLAALRESLTESGPLQDLLERYRRLEATLQGQAERDELDRLERGKEAARRAESLTSLSERVEALQEGVRGGQADAGRMREQMQRVLTAVEWMDAIREEVKLVREKLTALDAGTLRGELEAGMSAAREEGREATTRIETSLSQIAGRVEGFDDLAERLEASRRDAVEVLEALRERRRIDEANDRRAREDEAHRENARGVVLYHEGAVEAAAGAFRRALELRDDLAEAHSNLGLALSRMDRPDEAAEAFRRALELDPALPAALNNLGFLHQHQERHAEAVEMFRKALEADPALAPAYVNLGNAYYGMQDHERAVQSWRKALEIDPVNADAARALRSFDQEIPGAMG
ncbi:MAG: tetratricopeptide repeat protein [Acidobacteriota bacterium]|jgi:tetratricopeptide (TPR) repeat protein